MLYLIRVVDEEFTRIDVREMFNKYSACSKNFIFDFFTIDSVIMYMTYLHKKCTECFR